MIKELDKSSDWTRHGATLLSKEELDKNTNKPYIEVTCDNTECSSIVSLQEIDDQRCSICNRLFFVGESILKDI